MPPFAVLSGLKSPLLVIARHTPASAAATTLALARGEDQSEEHTCQPACKAQGLHLSAAMVLDGPLHMGAWVLGWH